MKSSSAQKRSRIEPELNQRIESKLLITSISRHALGTPSAILSRYEHTRHEEQLQKQYNLKFLTDRKRGSSGKKHSTSKRSGKDTRRQKMGDTVNLEPQRLFYQSGEFRQRYYNLHETHLKDKEKWISDAQKLLTIKEAISNFFITPDQYTARDLTILLDNEKIVRSIGRYLQNIHKSDQKEEVIIEVMKILQVKKSEEVLQNLRARVQRFRNLDECTFKILELESMNKKVVSDFQERIKKMRKDIEQANKIQLDKTKEELQLYKRSKMFLEEELTLHKEQYQILLNDLAELMGSEDETNQKWLSGRPEVVQIHKYIMSLAHKLRYIEVEAEQNMFRLLRSNEDMVKLEQLMSLIKDDMNKQLQEQEESYQQNLCEIGQLNKQMEVMEQQMEEMREKSTKSECEREKLKKEFDDEMSLITASLGLEQCHSAKINLRIQQLIRQLSFARHNIQTLSETVKEKDELLLSYSQKLQTQNIISSQLKETASTALYEKQQYKFLLNNLRDQVSDMKKHHNDEKSRILKQKDEEIVRSNKDILQSYSDLKDQNQELKLEVSRGRLGLEEGKVQIIFLKNKEEQSSKCLKEKEAELIKIKEENQRYKNYLKEIEASFKEVVEIEEISSRKAAALQSENTQNIKIIQIYQAKNQDLDHSNNELIQVRNQIKTQLQKTTSDVTQLQAEKRKLQSINVQFRLQSINKQNEISKLNEQLKNMTKQYKNYKLANEKLLGELNSVTRKLVMFRMETKKKYGDKYKMLRQMMADVKAQQQQMVYSIKTDYQGMVDWTVEQVGKMIEKVQVMKEGFKEENQYLEKLRQLEQQRFNQQEKLMQESHEEEMLRSQQRQGELHEKLIEKQNQIKAMEVEWMKAKQSPTKKINAKEEDKKELISVNIQCDFIPSLEKSSLSSKIQQTQSDISFLNSQNKQLRHSLHELKSTITQQFQSFLEWFTIESEKTEEIGSLQRSLKRKDTPIFPELDEKYQFKEQVDRNLGTWEKKKIQQQIEEINDSIDEAHIMEDVMSDKYEQGDNVNSILQILVEGDTEIPTVSYWKKIEANFLAIRRKLTKKNFNLKLDLSAIDSRDPSLPSPNSINCGQSDFFGKRIVSEPDELLDLREFKGKETNRSEKIPQNYQFLELLKHENQELKIKILSQTQDKAELQEKLYQQQMKIQSLQIKLVSIENETSIKGLQHNFKKVLDYIITQNVELFQQSCRIIMKMLHFTNSQIQDYEEKMNIKKKKKKAGLFGGLFKT